MINPVNLPRLFVEADLAGARIAIDASEAHYLGNVRRLGTGDELIVFDGSGTERVATVTTLRKQGAELKLGERIAPLPEPALRVILLQALVKSDAADFVVQKATELGVHAIRMVRTEFSVVRLDAARTEHRVAHWRRIARAACEQSRRHRPPTIAAMGSLATSLADLPQEAQRIALHPDGAAALASLPPPATSDLCIGIGPEGGFGPADLATFASCGFVTARLGPRVLRTETAAITACGFAQFRWGDLR